MLYTRTIGELQRQINQLERQLHRAAVRPAFSRLHANLPIQSLYGQLPFEAQAPWSFQTPWTLQQLNYCAPHTDILELDDQYLLEIALPGVVVDDVELKVEENCITVLAKRTPSMFEEKAAIVRKEMPVAFLYRQFEFDTEILAEQVEARMDRGILFVSVPKVEAATRVPVSVGAFEGHMPGVKTRVPSKSEQIRSGKEVSIK